MAVVPRLRTWGAATNPERCGRRDTGNIDAGHASLCHLSHFPGMLAATIASHLYLGNSCSFFLFIN